MKKLLASLVLVAWPAWVNAQPITPPIPIHGHPQLAAYTDESQLPTIAGHMNWAPGENPPASQVGGDGVVDIVVGRLGNSTLGHGHMSLIKCPIYAEIKEPLSCRFQILLFNVQAQAFVNPRFQDGVRDIVWDDTKSSTPPDMIGALGAERTWNGTLVFDPTSAKQFKTTHGWWSPNFNAEFRFANGDNVEKSLYPSFYVISDPSAPETPGYPIVSVRVSPHDVRHRENWGTNVVETLRGTQQYLPLVPLSKPYAFRIDTNGYGADKLPPATAEVREGSDIHHHVGGRVLQEMTKEKIIPINAVFDPASLGPGTHKVIVGRRQSGLFGDAAVVVQLVFDVQVGGTPPPRRSR